MDKKKQIIYGINAVREFLERDINSIEHIYFRAGSKNSKIIELINKCRDEKLPYNLLPEKKINSIAGTLEHQGVVAFLSFVPYISLEEFYKIIKEKKEPPLLLLPASVEDPQNLGAIIRSAVAFGVDILLLEKKYTAPLNATVAKTSAGMISHIPIFRPKNLESLIEELSSNGFQIVGAESVKGKTPPEINFTLPTLLIMGGENRAIPPYLLKKCNKIVSIPITQKVSSLNVSAATAILLYEISNQRSKINKIR
ncbi:MAG: 23S rRNA (guanosine(2251)-2'-O)-methyltransferase RlmB [Chitinispirillaceae bacterium]|nr:23S rRNA (guanosine(2251)-2'-O)-methyltransferase RlmB [Chitinispirillaceae bacterium]